MKATKVLIEEHKAVLIVLNIFMQIAHSDANIDKKDITNILEFLQVFVDKCHHTKEEQYLFPEILAKITHDNKKLINDLLSEHALGRQLVKKMLELIDAPTDEFSKAVSRYVMLLKNHIDKEDGILFPRADMLISEDEQAELYERFEEVELMEIGEGKHEAFHDMIKNLQDKYSKLSN